VCVCVCVCAWGCPICFRISSTHEMPVVFSLCDSPKCLRALPNVSWGSKLRTTVVDCIKHSKYLLGFLAVGFFVSHTLFSSISGILIKMPKFFAS
jgi:hypothetical protein